MSVITRIHSQRRKNGFSLVELLLVLAIIGIISAFAIPAFLGQRRRAQVIGDASANCRVLAMQLETYKADNGNYGAPGATATWSSASVTPPAAYTTLPFVAKGNSKMDFELTVGATGLTYTIAAKETGTGRKFYEIDQNNTELYRFQ